MKNVAFQTVWFKTLQKTFQILFKTPNKTVPYPEDYILEMGNTEFVSMPSTKFLGIVLDDAINFQVPYFWTVSKIEFCSTFITLLKIFFRWENHDQLALCIFLSPFDMELNFMVTLLTVTSIKFIYCKRQHLESFWKSPWGACYHWI